MRCPPASRRSRLLVFTLCATATALALLACGEPRPATQPLPTAAASSSPAAHVNASTAAPISSAPTVAPTPPRPPVNEADLTISFHPQLSGNNGWIKSAHSIALDSYALIPEAKLSLVNDFGPRDATLDRIYKSRLPHVKWATTALLLSNDELCWPELRNALDVARPSRLLLGVRKGLSHAGVACMRELPVQRILFSGCLHRPHRKNSGCDGDGELAMLHADLKLRERIGGLALSLSKRASLKRLAHFPNLTHLALAQGREPEPDVDMSALPFDGFKNLRHLDLRGWKVTHWLPSPAALDMVGRLHVLQWRGHLPRVAVPNCALRGLFDDSISEQDLTALAGCGELRELSASNTWIEDLTPLLRWPKLQTLHLDQLEAKDSKPLAKLSELRDLALFAPKTKDFQFLAQLPLLEKVEVSRTSFGDLTLLRDLAHLRKLDVSNTRIRYLGPLASIKTLRDLDIGYTKVRSIKPLAGLLKLERLNIAKTPVTDLKPLKGHPSLQDLYLHQSGVRDITPLFSMPKLRFVNIRDLKLPAAQVKRLKEQVKSVQD